MNLCDPQTIRAVLERHGFHFSKSLGQNFLTDARIPARIAQESGAEGENVVEIGPGMGCLTAALCERATHVVAIELDRALLPVLADTLSGYENHTVVHGDVLKLDLAALCRAHFGSTGAVACANLPYYITTPAITALLQSGAFSKITVMVQLEVAQRLCAQAASAAYGAFTLFVQYYAQTALLFEVPASCFVPQPKVNSAVVQLTPLAQPAVQVRDQAFLFSLIKAAFGMRRKTLVNALQPIVGSRVDKAALACLLHSFGIDERVRGERLTLQQFALLSDALGEMLYTKQQQRDN